MVMKIGAPPPKGEKDTRYEQQRPEFSMEQKAWSQFRMFCNLFGFSPAARARLMIDDELNEGKTPGKRAATLEDILSGPELPRPGQSIQ